MAWSGCLLTMSNVSMPSGGTRVVASVSTQRGMARIHRGAAKLAMFSAMVAFAAYLANATHALLDDGPQLVQDFGKPSSPQLWNHVLYFPVARLVAATGLSTAESLLLASVASGALLVGVTCLIGYVLSGKRSVAAVAAVAAMTTPVVACHATFVEVHALHAACVAIAVLLVLASPPRMRALSIAIGAGAALSALSHRSAPLMGPALALLGAARLCGIGLSTLSAMLRSGAATVVGLLLALAADDMLHRAYGGPRLFDSVDQVRDAIKAPMATMVVDESLLAIGPLLLLATLAMAGIALRRGAAPAERFQVMAPIAALVTYGLAIVVAGVPTRGGYWMGAVPFLCMGIAQGLGSLPSSAHAVLWKRLACVVLLWLNVLLAFDFAQGDGVRHRLHAQRFERIARASTLMPFGGHLLSSGISKQYVDGAASGVTEHDFGSEIARRLVAGDDPARIASDLRACVDRLLQSTADDPVVWTREWRLMALSPEYERAMTQIESLAFRGLRMKPAQFGDAEALVLERVQGQ